MSREQPNPVAAAIDRMTAAVLAERRRAKRRSNRELEGEPIRDPTFAYDTLGRKVPRRFNAGTWARAIPGYLGRFSKTVPAEMFVQIETGIVEIACPCGESHRAELGVPAYGNCGRHFIYDGAEVRVAPPVEGDVPAEP